MKPDKNIHYTASIFFVKFVGEWRARLNMPGNSMIDDSAGGWGSTPSEAVADLFGEPNRTYTNSPLCVCGHTDAQHDHEDTCRVSGCECDNFKRAGAEPR